MESFTRYFNFHYHRQGDQSMKQEYNNAVSDIHSFIGMFGEYPILIFSFLFAPHKRLLQSIE